MKIDKELDKKIGKAFTTVAILITTATVERVLRIFLKKVLLEEEK